MIFQIFNNGNKITVDINFFNRNIITLMERKVRKDPISEKIFCPKKSQLKLFQALKRRACKTQNCVISFSGPIKVASRATQFLGLRTFKYFIEVKV